MESERESEERREGGKKIGNDVSALGQLPRLLIKNADERGGEDDPRGLKFAQGIAGN